MAVYNYYDFFLEKMLAEIPEAYDTTFGGPLYDICSGCAMIAAEQADQIQANLDLLDPRNRTGSDLDAYIYDHSGLERKDGAYAAVVLEITGSCMVDPNCYFSTASGIAFRPIASYRIITSGEVECECVLQGEAGNVGAGKITKSNQSVVGLISVTNPNPASGGIRRETDEEFLERYYAYLQKPQGAGTVEAIRLEVEQIEGVGSVKVIPDRPNATATVIITASDGSIPTSGLIDRIQNIVDPKGTNNETWGLGYGIAPIGLRLDITAPTGVNLVPQIWLDDPSVIDAAELADYFDSDLYKSTIWQNCYESGTVDYLNLYSACQSTMIEYADLNGLTRDAVNIRKFAFIIGNGAAQYQDYDLGDTIPIGNPPVLREA